MKEFRLSTGMTQQQFADYFGLPVRSLQEWEQQRKTPPAYILELCKRIWRLENPDQ